MLGCLAGLDPGGARAGSTEVITSFEVYLAGLSQFALIALAALSLKLPARSRRRQAVLGVGIFAALVAVSLVTAWLVPGYVSWRAPSASKGMWRARPRDSGSPRFLAEALLWPEPRAAGRRSCQPLSMPCITRRCRWLCWGFRRTRVRDSIAAGAVAALMPFGFPPACWCWLRRP